MPRVQPASTRPATCPAGVSEPSVHGLEREEAEAENGAEGEDPVQRVARGREVGARVGIGLPSEHPAQEAVGAPALLFHWVSIGIPGPFP